MPDTSSTFARAAANAAASAEAAPAGLHARLRMDLQGFVLDVDLRLPGRGVTAISGPSGSGKTSLLRGVAGLVQPEIGFLSVNGDVWLDTARSFSLPVHKRRLGYVFQEANLFAHLSVLDNLRYGLKRIPAAERQVQLDQAAALLGIEHLLARMPKNLSGGERQRVAMARALLTSPRLLLMDEPLAAVDDARKQEILPYLERLHEQLDIPVLYVSHSQDELARLADHLVLMREGKAIGSGPVAATLANLHLPPARGDDASVVVDGHALAYDENYCLLTVGLPRSASTFRVVHEKVETGRPIRLVVRARDVSLALSEQSDGSMLNVLPVQVLESAPASNPAQMLVRLDAGGTLLLARITRYSHDQLALAPRKQVWAQIKSVSLLV